MPQHPSILFLCTGNSARSQMAEGYARTKLAGTVKVQSAGTRPRPIHPMTIRVMKEIDVDLSGHASTALGELGTGERFTFVIFVCGAAEQECPKTFAPSAVRYTWPFDDPVGPGASDVEQLEKFRLVRDEIIERIDRWVRTQIPERWRRHADGK